MLDACQHRLIRRVLGQVFPNMALACSLEVFDQVAMSIDDQYGLRVWSTRLRQQTAPAKFKKSRALWSGTLQKLYAVSIQLQVASPPMARVCPITAFRQLAVALKHDLLFARQFLLKKVDLAKKEV